MTGNALEWVMNGDEVTVRGGYWSAGPATALTMNESATQRDRHDAYLGIRLCADPPARVNPADGSSR
jgi:hypothetical protein